MLAAQQEMAKSVVLVLKVMWAKVGSKVATILAIPELTLAEVLLNSIQQTALSQLMLKHNQHAKSLECGL